MLPSGYSIIWDIAAVTCSAIALKRCIFHLTDSFVMLCMMVLQCVFLSVFVWQNKIHIMHCIFSTILLSSEIFIDWEIAWLYFVDIFSRYCTVEKTTILNFSTNHHSTIMNWMIAAKASCCSTNVQHPKTVQNQVSPSTPGPKRNSCFFFLIISFILSKKI